MGQSRRAPTLHYGTMRTSTHLGRARATLSSTMHLRVCHGICQMKDNELTLEAPLQYAGIVPRTPSPPPLEDKEELTLEEVKQLQAEMRERKVRGGSPAQRPKCSSLTTCSERSVTSLRSRKSRRKKSSPSVARPLIRRQGIRSLRLRAAVSRNSSRHIWEARNRLRLSCPAVRRILVRTENCDVFIEESRNIAKSSQVETAGSAEKLRQGFPGCQRSARI